MSLLISPSLVTYILYTHLLPKLATQSYHCSLVSDMGSAFGFLVELVEQLAITYQKEYKYSATKINYPFSTGNCGLPSTINAPVFEQMFTPDVALNILYG